MNNCTNNICQDKKQERSECSCHSHTHSDSYNYRNLIISFTLLVLGIFFSIMNFSFFNLQWFKLAWYIVAYIPVATPILLESWNSIENRDYFSEFTLMTIATIGAFFIGEYPEGVAVMLFYSVGELFQERAIGRAKKNISSLIDSRPKYANVIRDGSLHEVSPQEVLIGEIIEVKAGQSVPIDGKLINDISTFNTAALTGESTPKVIKKGEAVFSGMVATNSFSAIEITKSFENSTLSRILDMIENSVEKKAPTERFIRKFARIYTPIVVILALIIVLIPYIYSLLNSSFIYDFYSWAYSGLVFLVISCPCALVVSIPLGYFGGIGLAAKHGILFKGNNYVDAIANIDCVIMDKTGTLTKGLFEVNKIVSIDDMSEKTLIQIVSSVEAHSTHPIAKAIVEYANEKEITLLKPRHVEEIAGYGLKALIDNKNVLVGNGALMTNNNIYFPKELLEYPQTVVFCSINGQYIGYIMLADTIKEDAKQAIEKLKKLDIKKIVILSGDNQKIVDTLAKELDIRHSYGNLLPLDKVEFLEKIKLENSNIVAFVGDGINDAPVLAISDIGISMGRLGSDIAIQTADVVIQNDQPSKVATAIKIGKLTKRKVIENICLALGVKIAILLLGVLGYVSLWGAVFADVGVALIAILNSVAILNPYYKIEKK